MVTSSPMVVLVGCLLGCVVGWGAWLAARSLAGPEPVSSAPAPPPEAPLRGAISRPAVPAAAGMALWGTIVGWRSGRLDQTVLALLLTGLLLTLSLVDFRVRRIPNVVLLALLGWGLGQMLWLPEGPTVAAAALGLALAGGLFLVLSLFGRGALGAGDVKLAAVLGAILGYPAVLPALFGGAVAGGAAALWLLATHRIGRKDPMAYGPYLALGAWAVWTLSLRLWS